MAQEKEYFAFISYQRKDEEWADRLRSKLEHYRLPSSVRKQDASLPKEIRPIFRDALELAGGVLAKEIETALQQSKFLIVICSPNSAKSPWVNKEIQTFIDLGREDRIIPFIIDGTPFSDDEKTECFPPALRSLKGEKELLGINIKEINRDAACIKVIARMFGLKFDSLWQRFEREQRFKKWLGIGASVLLAVIGFSIGGFFIKQNRHIEKQNVQLQDFVRSLEEENNTFSQLRSDQKQYVFVGQMRGNGCDDLPFDFIDYHPYEPIVAFTDSWGVWLHYIISNVEVNLPSDYKGEQIINLHELCFSADGTKLRANGCTSTYCDIATYIWDIENYTIIDRYSEEEKKYMSRFPDRKSQHNHLLDKVTYDYENGKLCLYETIQHRSLCSTDFDSNDSEPRCILNPTYDEMLFVSKGRAALYDDTKKSFVLFFKGYGDPNEIEFSVSGDYLRIEKSLYARTFKIDTIQDVKYSVHQIGDYPTQPRDVRKHYDTVNHASIDVQDESIIYKSGNLVKKTEVVKEYTTGNMQEHLSDAIFAGPNKVVAIVEQGKFRIYNSKSWKLLGTLTNYIWTEVEGSTIDCGGIGHETELGHSSNFIASAKVIRNKLYVLSSGGVIRIYDINKYRLETIIELPIESSGEDLTGVPIDKSYLSDDASRIIYSYEGQQFFYECYLPQINEPEQGD